MKNILKKISIGFAALAVMFTVGVGQTFAAAVDYASSTGAVDDATSGLGSALLGNSLKVIGIALSVWALFWAIGKLRKTVK